MSEKAEDIDAVIAAAIKQEEERLASTAPAAEPPAQPRDDAGKFAAKDEAPEDEAPAAAAESAPEEPDDYDEAVGLDRDTWKLTPAQARERAKALAREAKEAAERAEKYAPLERVLAPRRDALRASYGGEDRALETLFHLSDWAARDPAGFVQHIAQQRGVDLARLAPQPADPQQQPQVDVDALIAQRVAAEIEKREATRAIQDFESNTAYEFRHEPEVRRTMAGLLQSGAASDYASAYTMAVKALPTYAAKLAERERAEQVKREAVARPRDREKVAAAVTVRGAPGSARPATTPPPATIEEAIRRAWEQEAGTA